MKLINSLLFLLAFLNIFLVPAYSITIEDLVNSYNYTYSSKEFSLNTYNTYKFDENRIYLELNLSGKLQNYTLIQIISNANESIVKSKLFTIFSNVNIVNNTIEISSLTEEGSYTISIFIYDKENKLVYRNYNLTEIELNSTQYSLSSFYEISDHNTKYSKLNINSNSNFFLSSPSFSVNESNSNYNSDIAIKNISYDNITGKGVIEITNFGNLDAIYYSINIFDENFNILNQTFEDYLFQNQTKEVEFNIISNLTNFFIILDYKNNLEEKIIFNNILSWPVNLIEMCNDYLDNNRNSIINENCNITIITNAINITNISEILDQNISNTDFSSTNYSKSILSGGGEGSSIKRGNLNLKKENSIDLNQIIDGANAEIREKECFKLFLVDKEENIELLKINLEYVELKYNDETIILNKGESFSIDYENKSIKIEYIKTNLEKALFNIEFEKEKDKLEIKKKLELNLDKKENLDLENSSIKNEINTLTNISLNLYNSSDYYYFNSSLNKSSESEKFNLKYYLMLILVIIIIISVIIILR